MAVDFAWIYIVIFLGIPLARIIPRMISKRKRQNQQRVFQQPPQHTRTEIQSNQQISQPHIQNSEMTTKMLTLGKINMGFSSFEKIQRDTGLDGKELDKVLEELEKEEMLKVQQRQGFFGPKIELLPTEKGFREFESYLSRKK